MNLLRQMGFREKWLGWIRFCINTVRFYILVIGYAVVFFPSGRGLRWRDPLFPFLFILAMEGFDSMMKVALKTVEPEASR